MKTLRSMCFSPCFDEFVIENCSDDMPQKNFFGFYIVKHKLLYCLFAHRILGRQGDQVRCRFLCLDKHLTSYSIFSTSIGDYQENIDQLTSENHSPLAWSGRAHMGIYRTRACPGFQCALSLCTCAFLGRSHSFACDKNFLCASIRTSRGCLVFRRSDWKFWNFVPRITGITNCYHTRSVIFHQLRLPIYLAVVIFYPD